MKIKNQNRIPSKYVLLILIVVCGILMGAEQLTGGKGPLSFVANYTIIPMQKGIGYIGRWTGAGTEDRYTGRAMINRFYDKTQVSILVPPIM